MRRMVAGVAGIVLVASAGVVGFGAAEPAGAATVSLNLSCSSSTPVGTLATNQTIGFDETAPATVEPSQGYDESLVFPPDTVSSSQDGGSAHVDYIADLSYHVPVPANAKYVGGDLSGGFNYGSGTPTVTLQGTPTTGTVVYSIPGPIPTDQQFQIPALTLHMQANGAIGSQMDFELGGSSASDPGFTTTAHVTSPFNGDAATSCWEPAPKTIWNSVGIVQVDTTPPTITLNTPADGAQYPQNAAIHASYTCDDGAGGSGVATCTGDVANGALIDTSSLGPHTFTVSATDNKGNAATPVTHSYTVIAAGEDTTPPTIDLTTPADGAVYQQNAVVDAAYSCADTESSVSTCAGTVASGSAIDTSTVGPHTFVVNAVDSAGNPYSVSHAFRVVPGPSVQTFSSGDVSNQIPVACDNQFQTAHKTLPVTSVSAPTQAASGGQFTWSVALGADFIPSLYNGTNLLYKFAAPANGHFVSAALTGAGSEVNGSAIKVNSDGTLSLSITSVTDQSTGGTGIGQDNFTPPPFSAVVAVDGAPGTAVTTKLAEFDVTVTGPLVLPTTTTSKCTAGDPTYNNRTNPTLTTTDSIDVVPPTVNITSPVNGSKVAPNSSLTLRYSCTDDHGTPSCTGDKPSGTALDTSVSGVFETSVTAVDPAGNTTTQWSTWTVDDPTVTVSDAPDVLEGPNVTSDFTVTASNATNKTMTVNYATGDGTAIAGTDYVATSGVLTFAPGDPLSKTVSVPVINDSVWRGDRTLSLTLVSALHANIGSPSTGSGTIHDDDPPPVSVADAAVREGNNAQLDFAVSIAGNPSVPVEVDYHTVDGSATTPARYAAKSGSLTFDPGAALVQHVLVSVVNDTIYDESSPDPTQTMFLSVTEPANGTSGLGTGTITDDEPSPPVVNIGSESIAEGDAYTRPAKLTVTLNKPWTQTVTVPWQTTPGTANTLDYKSATGVLTFNPGQISKTIGTTVIGDTSPESDETFSITLGKPKNAFLGNGNGVVTIVDDDHPTATGATVSVTDNTVYEGGGLKANSVTMTVSLNRRPTASVTIPYKTVTGTAGYSDFSYKAGTLTFSPTQVSKTIPIKIIADNNVEPNETFTLVLGSPTGPVTVAKGTGTVTIMNDD